MESVSKATATNVMIDKVQFINSVYKFGLPTENKPNNTRQVKGFNYSKVMPTPLNNVRIGVLSKPCLEWMGVSIP